MASGLPDEQARAERGFGRLKDEEVDWQRERMVASAKANLGRVIDESSTVKRPHSSLRYRSPVAFEAADGAARTA